MRKWFLTGLLILLILPISIWAATPPQYIHLGDITNGLDRPVDLAIDSAGNIYVTQGIRNEVVIFSREGIRIGSINISSPISVAVGGGYLYVGSRDGYVSVYTPSGSFIKKIWQKDFHFHRPAAIAVNETNIFISDNLSGVIDVIDLSGNQVMQIDSVDRPMGMFISGNNLYVVDLAFNNGGYQGAEIKVYDLSGNLINRFGSYGVGEGRFAYPFDIVVDDGGRVYVSDAYTAGIQVLDASGTFLTAIYDAAEPLSNPKGIAMGPDGRFFVVSMMDSKIQVYGIDDYTYLTVSPPSLTIEAQVGKPVPPVTLTIGNEGAGTLTYNITSSEAWVSIASPTGVVSGASSVNIDVSADISTLTPGQYPAVLTITDDSGITETVDVTLNLYEEPVLTVTPSSLSFSYTIGGDLPSSRTVNIELSNDLFGTTSWTATSQDAWLSFTPSTATGNSYTQMGVSVNPEGLSEGTYNGSITITADSLVNGSPAIINILLEVIGEGGGGGGGSCIDRVVATLNNYGEGPSTIKVVDNSGSLLQEISPAGISGGIDTAISDINGDGIGEIIVGLLKDSSDVIVFNSQGSEVVRFSAFSEANGVRVYGGDIDKNGTGEVIVTGGKKSSNVRLFIYDGLGFIKTGIDFKPYTEDINNLRVASGDIDGDGSIELVTVARRTKAKDSILKIWDIDTSQGVGNWKVTQSSEQNLNGKEVRAIDVEDINNDGIKDILIATKDGLEGIVNGQTTPLFSKSDIKDMETGDINGDGIKEIVLGMKQGLVSIFTIDGINTGNLAVFNSDSDVRISTGCLGY